MNHVQALSTITIQKASHSAEKMNNEVFIYKFFIKKKTSKILFTTDIKTEKEINV